MNEEYKKASKNTLMLYLMNIAKLVFPLLTLPYLTRVLTVEGYALVAYVKAVMQYVQIILMFGFSLSATSDIVNAKGNKLSIGLITGNVLGAKGILSIVSFFALIVLSLMIPLLYENPLYTMLSFINVVITEMLADFLFRGLDRMEVITTRFVTSKTVATLLTFIFISGDNDLIFIPLFDIFGAVAALILVLFEIRKLGIRIAKPSLSGSLKKLHNSAVYFFSDMATTAFGALNTLLIGIFLPKADISYWSLALQLIAAVQSMYIPITNGIYPTMVRTKSLKFLKKVFSITMPFIALGCILCIVLSNFVMTLLGGTQYSAAAPVFRALVPVLLFSFPGMLFGWPALDPIGKKDKAAFSTILAAVIQSLGLGILVISGYFTLFTVAILRGFTEGLMMLLRIRYCYIYRNEFNS